MEDCQNNDFTNDDEIFKPRKREFPNLKVCHGQNRCIQYKGTWKLGCIPILWLDQLLEAQEETLGGW